MIEFFGPDFLLNLIKFLGAVVFAFYIPGNIIVRKISISFWQKIGLSLILGVVLWGYQGFILGFLSLRFATYFYLLGTLFFWIYLNRKFFTKGNFGLIKDEVLKTRPDFLLLGIITVGIIFHLSAVWFTAVPRSDGLWFCCRSVPDNIAHLVRTEQVVQRFPPYEAGVDGIILKNYHYWASIVAAEVTRIFGADLVAVTFKFFPLLIELLLAGAVTSLASLLNLKKAFGRWLGLFVFWSGDVLYLLIWLTTHKLNLGYTVFDDATKLLAGPPRAFSMAVIFWGLFVLLLWIRKRNLILDLIIVLVFASLVGFKIYTAIFAFSGFGLLGFYFLLKKDLKRIAVLGFVALGAITIYLPVNGSSGNSLIFHLPWVVREFALKPELGIVFLMQRRDLFFQDNKWLKAMFYDWVAVAIFFISLFGTVNFAFLQSRKSLSRIPIELHLFLVGGIVVSLILGLFSAQTNGGANTIQLIIALNLFCGIYAALALSTFMEKKSKIFVVTLSLLIAVLTMTRSLHEGIQNLRMDPNLETVLVSPEKLKVFSILKQQKNDGKRFILSPSWALQESWLYSSYLSEKPMFLGAFKGVQLDHNVLEAKDRLKINQEIFQSQDEILVFELLAQNNIEYLLFSGEEIPKVGSLSGRLQPLYLSNDLTLLRFDPSKPILPKLD